jgi:ABC-type branched-subunit amino acid transport system substrate-binding protein
MINKKVISLTMLIIALTFLGCHKSYDESKKERANTARESKDTIMIGVAWPDKEHNFVKGALLAAKEINDNGGILNKPLQLLINDEEQAILNSSLKLRQKQHIGIEVANSYANNPSVIAVIGHRFSTLAIPASIVYQNHGIVFLAPTATNLNLTSHNFNYIFRMHPNNEEMGEQLAGYCQKLGYKKIVILYDRGSYGLELANSFLFNAEKSGIEMVIRRSFSSNRDDFTDIMVELRGADKFDAIFVAAGVTMVSKIYQESRDMNILVPFVGGETLDSDTFWNLIKEWEISDQFAKSFAPTLFNELDPLTQSFINKFKQEYGESVKPERYAGFGYDAIKIIEHAIKRAQSTVPIKIAETLRYMPPCQSVTGQYHFQKTGDIRKKNLYFKMFRQGKFKYENLEAQTTTTSDVWICGDIDQDKDAIPNDIDRCPNNTPEEIYKGVYRQGALRGCPIDTDEDSYQDYRDDCPNNQPHEFEKGIDPRGCPTDSDNDAVPDYRDDCPNNSRLEIRKGVDSRGCPTDTDKDTIQDYEDVCFDNSQNELSKGIYQQGDYIGCPIDSDNDGIADYRDNCPNNQADEIRKGVTARGCPIDRDMDAVFDYQDNCPNNSHLELRKGVDSHGCPVDVDQDNVLDYQDLCLNNSLEEISQGVYQQGNQMGCPIDGDQDGVPDYHDNCPGNSLIEIGKGVDSRGCPVDTDKDGIQDYQDVCFNDSLKAISKGVSQEVNQMGCPIDSDKDGVADYRDDCPDDSSLELRKGVDLRGCPLDTDKDGIPDYKDPFPNKVN